jgi:hypothetical protein
VIIGFIAGFGNLVAAVDLLSVTFERECFLELNLWFHDDFLHELLDFGPAIWIDRDRDLNGREYVERERFESSRF